uniref:Abhydrolase domain-containing protein 7 n=1 Tax=Caligus clemensi TaxID=344056 RepID=C1C0X6_CALCM|nr:Abhydrolase domain-containing protein 7 [Caligus clemensi]
MLRPLLLRAIGFLIAIVVFIPLVIQASFKFILKEAFVTKPRKDRPIVFDSYGTHRYLELPEGNIGIHVVDSGTGESDSRPLMLFVHGFPDFWYSYRHQIKYFSSQFRCVSMDNRGYNESDKPENIRDYAVDKLANDVKEVVQLLGYDKCILVGHDWGGSICYRVCALFPEIISFYIVLNMPHPLSLQDSLKSSWAQKLSSWYFFFFQCPVLPEVLINSFDMKNWDKIFQDIPYDSKEEQKQDSEAYKYVFSQRNALRGPVNYYRCSFQYPEDMRRLNDKIIRVPVCSIFGNADKFFLRESFMGSVKYVEDLTIKELKGISPWVHLHAKEDVNRTMDDYITQRRGLVVGRF